MKMNDFYRQQYSSPGYPGAECGVPPYSSYDSYHLGSDHHIDSRSSQPFQTNAVATLQSKIAQMEVDMAQRGRDIAEAQTIIQYLLKLNASSHQLSMGYCQSDSLTQNKSAESFMGGEIKDLLGKIIDILHSKLNTIGINNDHSSSSNNCASVSCGDLLDISDKAVSPDAVRLESTIPFKPLDSIPTEASHNLQSKQPTIGSVAEEGLGQSLAACQEIQGRASDDFPSQPYVNRFSHAGNQIASCKRAESAVSHLFELHVAGD